MICNLSAISIAGENRNRFWHHNADDNSLKRANLKLSAAPKQKGAVDNEELV